jgi:endonuclease/exonuclease/phosphatase (EEP) superfamily protein YafD
MRYRSYLVGTVCASAALLFVLLVAIALWCLLGALGDAAGARVARVLALLVGICWVLDTWAILMLLAWRQMFPAATTDDELLES